MYIDTCIYMCIYAYIRIYVHYIRGAYDKFPDIFRLGTFIDSTHMELRSQLSHNDSLWALGITKSHWEQGLDYRDGEEVSWSNSQRQQWSC